MELLPDFRKSGSFIGMAGLAVVLFVYGASATVIPAWAVVVLLLVWLVVFALACRWFLTRPLRVLALPVVALALWFGAIFGGAKAFGWSA